MNNTKHLRNFLYTIMKSRKNYKKAKKKFKDFKKRVKNSMEPVEIWLPNVKTLLKKD